MKYLTLLIALLTTFVWQSNAQVLNQAASWPNSVWTLTGSGTGSVGLVANPTVSTNFSYNDNATGPFSLTDEVIATSPNIDLTAASSAGETWINVNYAYTNSNAPTFNLEWYDSDASVWVLWDNILDNSNASSGWCTSAIATTSSNLDVSSLSSTQLTGFKYRFYYDASGFGVYTPGMCVSSPAIISSTPPFCLDPTNLSATNILDIALDITWDNTGADSYNVEYGPAGFTLGNGNLITGTVINTENITGLTSLTSYEVYVQSECGLINGASAWVGPISFTTSCAVYSAPWTETFTGVTDPTCWVQSTTTGGPWVYTGNPGFDVAGTLDNTNGVANNYAWIDFNGLDVDVTLTSPIIDATALNSPELRFWTISHTLNAVSPYNSIFLEASDGAGTWSTVSQVIGETGPDWVENIFDLSSYVYGLNLIQIRFRAESGGDVNDFYNDLLLDDVSIIEAPSCPPPSNLSVTSADLTSADFSWTSNGPETEWELEYGAPGFTQGNGSIASAGPTPNGSITGLSYNTFYEVYLRAVCAAGDTSDYIGPIGFNTFNHDIYMDHSTECPTGGFIDISATGTNLLLADDGESSVDPLPFPILFQGTLMNNMTVGNNGGLQLGAIGAEIGYGGVFTTLPDGTMFPWGDDLDDDTGNGYYEVIGTSPNQTLIIQWDNSCNFSGSLTAPTVTFQIQIEETGDIYYVYDDVVFGGTNVADDFGAFADIGISGQNQDITISTNDPQYLTDNSCVRFYYTDCPKPINYTVNYTTFDEAGISWGAGLATETNWTITYGNAGFDPTISGTTVTSNAPALIIPGLDDVTEYDIYIYADCNPGVLQSIAATGSFSTLPNCADVTALSALSASDSILTSWTFVENPGFPSVSFNIEYGNNGYTQGTGTLVNADNNFTDTTMDVSLLSGALYDVYVQSLCGTDSSNFVGPFTVTMPLDNDSTCLPENLMVDGTVYTFDKTGASSQLGEVDITPPITGYNTNDGWGQSGLTYSTWFTFEAPASGQVRINATDQEFAGQMAVYDVGDCTDFTTFTVMGANDNDVTGSLSTAPNFTVCGLTPGNTYYLMHDANSVSSTISNGGIYSLAISDITLEGGATNGMVDVCVGDTVDLFTAITGYDMGGTWYQEIPTLGLNGSEFVSSGLAYQVYTFQYGIINGCAMDSVVQQIEVYGPSSAGTDGTITACQNEPIDLLIGLSGNVDLGGTWYDPTNTATLSAITIGSLSGSFNYDYVTGNGVCPDDTANVILSVDPSCDYLNIEKVAFKNMSIFPNPTNGSVFVKNQGSSEVFNLELTDVNGKVIVSKNAAVNGAETTEISLGKLESGFYLIRVFNDNADRTFRIIKE